MTNPTPVGDLNVQLQFSTTIELAMVFELTFLHHLMQFYTRFCFIKAKFLFCKI